MIISGGKYKIKSQFSFGLHKKIVWYYKYKNNQRILMLYTKHLNTSTYIALSLCALTLLSGAVLASSITFADVVDDVAITAPVSCNITDTLDEAHTATINPGQYKSEIGTTSFQVFCNDNSGYAIYAIGYSNEEYGNTKMLATVGGSLSPTDDINTSTNISGSDSSWSMKLIPVTGTYAPTIENGYDDYNVVPATYTKVATFASSTDFTIGSSLQSTYQVYINDTKPAGTYVGKVKYTLVHPNDAPAPLPAGKIGVNYNANGSSFAGGAAENNVVYKENCTTKYQGNTPTISKTPNVNNDGTASSGYQYDFTQTDPVTINGAEELKVELQYGIEENYDYLYIFQGVYSGEVTANMDAGQIATYTGGNNEFSPGESTTFTVSGDTVTFAFFGDDYEDDGYYGYYAKVYPIYDTEQENTTPFSICGSVTTDTGTYATTTDWYGSWYGDIGGEHYDFLNEAEVKTFLENNAALSGSTINLYRSLTFNEAYAKAGKTQTDGYYSQQDLNKNTCQTVAMGQNSTVKDIRDGNTYMIGRLKDGNCWMLDNLALDPTDATTAANMNASNTNATAAAINNLLHGGSSTTGWSNVAVADVDTGFTSYTAPRINNASKDTLVTSYGPASTNGQAKVGIYYNYCAASAGTYCYESGQGVDIPDTLIDAPQDLCPTNWRMPTSEDSNGSEYGELISKYATSDATDVGSLQYNLSTPLSGHFSNGSANNQGNNGNFWSSSFFYDLYGMYGFEIYSDEASVYDYGRSMGLSMRCIAGF